MFPRHPPSKAVRLTRQSRHFRPAHPERRERDSPEGPPTGLGWPHGGEPGNSRVSLRRNDRPGFLLANQAIAQRSVFKPRTLISPSSRNDRAGQGRQTLVLATTTPAAKLTGKSMTRHLAQTVVQGLQGNPQLFGCLRLVAVVFLQHPQNHFLFHLP